MGTIGAGIWDDDVAQDIKETLGLAYAYNDDANALEEVFRVHQGYFSHGDDDEDYFVAYYALADWLWKKGRLPENIKNKVISMLENMEGMERFYETEDKQLINQRINELKSLKDRLESPQPKRSRINARISKAKYKIGDIIVFKVVKDKIPTEFFTKEIPVGTYYLRDVNLEFNPEFYYENGAFIENSKIFDFKNKVLVYLCVDIEEKKYSNMDIKNVPPERKSILVQYDYCKENFPTIDELKACGYLPDFYDRNTRKGTPNHEPLGEKKDNLFINLDYFKTNFDKVEFHYFLAERDINSYRNDKYQVYERQILLNNLEEVNRFWSREKLNGEFESWPLFSLGGAYRYASFNLVREYFKKKGKIK